MGYCILFANGRTAFPDAIGLLFVVFLAAWAVNYVMKSSYSKKRAVAVALGIAFVVTLARDVFGADGEPFLIPLTSLQAFLFVFRLAVYMLTASLVSFLVFQRIEAAKKRAEAVKVEAETKNNAPAEQQ